jgi:hypothetical protein
MDFISILLKGKSKILKLIIAEFKLHLTIVMEKNGKRKLEY